MGSAKWLVQLASWAATVLVARLLTPSDYGLVGMAGIFIALVTIFSEFGLAMAIMTHGELTEDQVAQLNALAVVIGVVALVVTCAAANPLGRFFSTPQLPGVVAATSVVFAISAFRTVPYALLQRDLKFRYLAITESTQAAVMVGIMVLLAVLGFGYWTLVVGTICGNAIATALAVYGRPCGFVRPKMRTLRPILRVSWHLLVGRFSYWAEMNADVLVVGRLLGVGPLGMYSLAMTLASLPLDKITALVNQVSFPFLAAARSDLRAVRRLILVLTGALAVVVFPVTVGIALVANESVGLVLGPQWIEAGRPLQLLALWAAFRSQAVVLGLAAVVTGGTRLFMYVGSAEAGVMTAAFYVGSWFGIAGVAAAWVLVFPILRIPVWVWVMCRTKMSLAAYLSMLQPAISSTMFMSACVVGIKLLSPASWSAPHHLALEIMGGGVSYAVAAAVQRRRLVALYREFRGLGRPAVSSQGG